MDKAKLSTFIRLGSKLNNQCFGHLQDSISNTCAIGAAIHGKTGELPHSYLSENKGLSATEIIPELNYVALSPVWNVDWCNSNCWSSLKNVIIFLNDRKRWTREQIADWLESIGL
jgi:hypothetical protein